MFFTIIPFYLRYTLLNLLHLLIAPYNDFSEYIYIYNKIEDIFLREKQNLAKVDI